MELAIRNLQSRPVDEDRLEAAAREAAQVGVAAPDAPTARLPDIVSIAIVGDRRIRDLNRSYLGREGTTDVIAFEAEDEPDRRTGEVIVSADTALRQSEEYGHSLERELCLLVAHGVLHVLGYEDYDDEARARMMQLQEQALARMEGGSTALD
jgi:probable rRNA maturation factor